MADMPRTFVIHLIRAAGRRAQVELLLTQSPYPAEILEACDGHKLTQERLAGVYPGIDIYSPHYPFTLSAGEIGCFLSHRRAWESIVAQGLSYALILEDDVAVDPEPFKQAVKLAEEWVGKLGYIQFQVRDVRGVVKTVARSANAKFIRPELAPLRSSAQLVSQDAAKKLIALTEQFDRPVDSFLQMGWKTGLPMHCVIPSGVSDRSAETGGSTISAKRPLGEKLVREWKRLRYRRKIAAISKAHFTG